MNSIPITPGCSGKNAGWLHISGVAKIQRCFPRIPGKFSTLINTVVDGLTGELLSERRNVIAFNPLPPEPAYVKLYIEDLGKIKSAPVRQGQLEGDQRTEASIYDPHHL
jgi:hypothetical protein